MYRLSARTKIVAIVETEMAIVERWFLVEVRL